MLAEDCPFCELVRGEGTAYRVAEDEHTLAFLDQRPINPGHLLVIPKQHAPDFFTLDVLFYEALMRSVKRLAVVLDAVTHPKKVGVVIAGFDVPHTHVHLIPMHDYHDITSQAYSDPERVPPTDAQQQEIAAKLRQEVSQQSPPPN
ncbi:MAG TPA: HIT family protein [Ktedonobacterales bacterium]|jgi:histidine triad (HIT) family protein